MSFTTEIEVPCHHCGGTFVAEVATSLQIRLVPEQRERILRGTFNHWLCPHCGREVAVEPQLLYMDFDRCHWLPVLPARGIRFRGELERQLERVWQRNMVEHCPPMVREQAPRFARRIAFGLPQLTEKLRIWEAGLDDRVVELMKLHWWHEHLLSGWIPGSELLFQRTADDGALVFVASTAPGPDGMVVDASHQRPRFAYEELAAAVRADPQKIPPQWRGMVVDIRALFLADEPLPAEERGTISGL